MIFLLFMLFFTSYPTQISRILSNKTFLIKRKCLSLIFLVLNSYLFMIMPNVIIKQMKIRRNPNLIKCSCWPSQHCLWVILEEEKKEKINLMINLEDQKTILNATFAIKRAIGQLMLEGWRAAITVGTNDGLLTRLSNR